MWWVVPCLLTKSCLHVSDSLSTGLRLAQGPKPSDLMPSKLRSANEGQTWLNKRMLCDSKVLLVWVFRGLSGLGTAGHISSGIKNSAAHSCSIHIAHLCFLGFPLEELPACKCVHTHTHNCDSSGEIEVKKCCSLCMIYLIKTHTGLWFPCWEVSVFYQSIQLWDDWIYYHESRTISFKRLGRESGPLGLASSSRVNGYKTWTLWIKQTSFPYTIPSLSYSVTTTESRLTHFPI